MRLRLGIIATALLAVVAAVALLPGGPAPEPPGDRGQLTARDDAGEQPRQTSDGTPGQIATELPPTLRARVRVDNRRSWRVAPGVTFRRWDRTDRRGQVRAYLLRVDTGRAGVAVDYGAGRHVPDRYPLTRLLRRNRAVAGVNGGFFDIYDTGAPLGAGRDRQRGFLHGAAYTWRNAFWTDREGSSRIGAMPLTARIREYPQMEITNVNSPRVREGKIGIWDRHWGKTAGYSITDGQKDDVRMVVVRAGRVVASTTELDSDHDIDGTVLVGRGPGADQLAQLRVGARATVRWSLGRKARFAIGGERVLLRRGRVRVSDDRILHPRTAVGIDHDTGRVLLLVVDGRQPHSRGLTLVELARLMRQQGAEVALNLDGGGSSTMAGRNRRGRLRVLNRPSDGSQRTIPDSIAVLAGRR